VIPVKVFDEVKFQRQDGTCRRAWGWWIVGDVQFLFLQGDAPGTATIEVAHDLDGDGIFQRTENYTLDRMDQGVLGTCRELAESFNAS
jgi:hypothetical protein